ncbi:MAG: ribonuclease P protein component [Chloroflexi bacterium]|nr:ribonuclease P protein component [Chloroflexota bacterium]
MRSSADFRRVREEGRCWSNRQLVLCVVCNHLDWSRFGFSVSRRIGHAVTRNRLKRLLRHVVRAHLDSVLPGWDVVIIARRGVIGADYRALERAIVHLLGKAHLLRADGSDAAPDTQAETPYERDLA